MKQLQFPTYSFRFKNSENKVAIFDEIRKKFIIVTPEEWVRQHVVQFLLQDKKYPKSHINVEKLLKINGLNKRYDVVVYKPDGNITILIDFVKRNNPRSKGNSHIINLIIPYRNTKKAPIYFIILLQIHKWLSLRLLLR